MMLLMRANTILNTGALHSFVEQVLDLSSTPQNKLFTEGK